VNPYDLSASDLLIWGVVLHLVADWPLQNDWMANNKASLLHPAAYVHAGIHGLFLSLIFGWVAAPIAVTHILIDTRWPIRLWSRIVQQTQPKNDSIGRPGTDERIMLYDVGTEVRFWTDQVFHIVVIAVAALLVT
jgi:hypothetical protein